MTFFIIFKGLSLKQIKQFFFEGETPTLSKQPMHHRDAKIETQKKISQATTNAP